MSNKITSEFQRLHGKNRNSLTIDIDGLGRTIIFKNGGHASSPITIKDAAGGGVYSDGIFEPWNVEGEVIVNKDLAQWLLKIYQGKNFSTITSAVLETYSSTDDTFIKHKFLNARIAKIIDFSPLELGGQVSMKIAFSLNDLEASEIV